MALSRGNFNRGRGGRSKSDPLAVIGGAVFLIAFLGIIAVYLHISSGPSDAAIKPVEVPVITGVEILVPIETLDVGTSFQPTMFRKEHIPEEQVSGDTVRSFDELKGMYAKGILVKNQPILKGSLTSRQPVHILTAALPRRYRAVALTVEQPLLDNVDGWAQPGTDVDLVWLTDVFGKNTASVLAGPVRVLASNRATEGKPVANATQGQYVTVTLLLSLRDSIRVSLAAAHGKLTLGLRGQGDKRPNEASKPISSVIEERIAPAQEQPFVSVKISDQETGQSEVKRFNLEGRPLEE